MATQYSGQILVGLTWEWTEADGDAGGDALLDEMTDRIRAAAEPILAEYRHRPGVRWLDLI